MLFDKIKTETSKIHRFQFKDKVVNQNAIKGEKTFGIRGFNPGRLGSSPQGTLD